MIVHSGYYSKIQMFQFLFTNRNTVTIADFFANISTNDNIMKCKYHYIMASFVPIVTCRVYAAVTPH